MAGHGESRLRGRQCCEVSASHQMREQEGRVNRPESLCALMLLDHARDVPLAASLSSRESIEMETRGARQQGRSIL